VISLVEYIVGRDLGATKWPYFVGEWSLASTDCAQYLNGAFGGFDPNYYPKQHANRNTFNCNTINQQRSGETVGFQTCSVILPFTVSVNYGHCAVNSDVALFNDYKTFMCNLFSTYTSTITSNSRNIGFSFWTYKTGEGDRRIQQWDFTWNVDQNIIRDLQNPPTPAQCKVFKIDTETEEQ